LPFEHPPTVTQRESLSGILSQQHRTLVIPEVVSHCASTLIDPPHTPDVPTSPKLLKVLAVMGAYMLIVGAALHSVLGIGTSRFLGWFETLRRSRHFEGQSAPQGGSSGEYFRKTS
jgi:hypothetical protein